MSAFETVKTLETVTHGLPGALLGGDTRANFVGLKKAWTGVKHPTPYVAADS